MEGKAEDPIEGLRKLRKQNAEATEHWDKAVRYARVIKKLKTERNSARKGLQEVIDTEGESAHQMRLIAERALRGPKASPFLGLP